MSQNYASLYHSIHPKDLFFKFSSFVGFNNQAEISESEIFKKNPFLGGKMDNYGSIVAQNYSSLYHRITLNDFFFKRCSMIGQSKWRKITRGKYFPS